MLVQNRFPKLQFPLARRVRTFLARVYVGKLRSLGRNGNALAEPIETLFCSEAFHCGVFAKKKSFLQESRVRTLSALPTWPHGNQEGEETSPEKVCVGGKYSGEL